LSLPANSRPSQLLLPCSVPAASVVAAVDCSLALLHPEYSSFKVDTTNNNMELPPMFGPIHTVVAYKQLLEEATGMR
jgi:hypothetical protein